jgi:transposase-like protein
MAPATGEEPMKKAHFSEEQMVAIFCEADKTLVPEVARKHKISEQTIYNWRRHFGTLEPTDIKRLRGSETENAKLKRILAERDLEIDTLKEINRRKPEPLPSPRSTRYGTLPVGLR